MRASPRTPGIAGRPPPTARLAHRAHPEGSRPLRRTSCAGAWGGDGGTGPRRGGTQTRPSRGLQAPRRLLPATCRVRPLPPSPEVDGKRGGSRTPPRAPPTPAAAPPTPPPLRPPHRRSAYPRRRSAWAPSARPQPPLQAKSPAPRSGVKRGKPGGDPACRTSALPKRMWILKRGRDDHNSKGDFLRHPPPQTNTCRGWGEEKG